MSFVDDLDAAETLEKDFVDLPVNLNGKLHTLRFFQMDGIEWAEWTDHFPARPDVRLDMRYGYNLRPLALAVAPLTGKLVDGESLVDLTAEQWERMFKTLPGATVMRIGDVIWNLNEYLPGQAVEALKKESTPVSKRRSGSPKP